MMNRQNINYQIWTKCFNAEKSALAKWNTEKTLQRRPQNSPAGKQLFLFCGKEGNLAVNNCLTTTTMQECLRKWYGLPVLQLQRWYEQQNVLVAWGHVGSHLWQMRLWRKWTATLGKFTVSWCCWHFTHTT